ncbi:MAG: 2-C-methyl-D-erythritol 4-phosphate cytidylyltransferase [Dysgonomonas sp.]
MKNNVIIVAGGKGLRVGGELPKQFVPIGGKPVLMHSIEAFHKFDQNINIVVVLPESHKDYWSDLCKEYNFKIAHKIAVGGEMRFDSVRNGLKLVDEGLVAVHDAARPFISQNLIHRLFDLAKEKKAVIPVTDVTDSLREVKKDSDSRIIDRTRIKRVQTPQVFQTDVLKKAYQTDFDPRFMDDASVVEHSGEKVFLAEGETINIKITTPIDLEIAEVLIRKS